MITQEDVTRQIVITAEGRDAALSIERTMREFGHRSRAPSQSGTSRSRPTSTGSRRAISRFARFS
jgi:hypothetical protein